MSYRSIPYLALFFVIDGAFNQCLIQYIIPDAGEASEMLIR